MALPRLSSNQIEQIARTMGDTEGGFTGSEIGHFLAQRKMDDPDPGLTKWKRLYNAFCVAVNKKVLLYIARYLLYSFLCSAFI